MTLNSKPESNNKLNNKGQSLLEFVLLLAAITVLSISLLKIVNNGIGVYWKGIVTRLIESPDQQQIEFY